MKEFEVTSFIEFYSRKGYSIKEIQAVVDMWNKSSYRSHMFLNYFGLDEIKTPIYINGR
jgi:DNA-binding transcriptional MerR regulator